MSLWWCQCLVVSLQNPRDADPMTRVQAELDETKIILVRLQGCGWMLLPAQSTGGPWGTLWDHSPEPSMVWELPFLFPLSTSTLFSPWAFPGCPDTSTRALTAPPNSTLLSAWSLLLLPLAKFPSPLGLQSWGAVGRWDEGWWHLQWCGAGAGTQLVFLWQHNTMESLLERGEKLDDLVSKSEVLGAQSKAFYKTVSVEGHPLHQQPPTSTFVLCWPLLAGEGLWGISGGWSWDPPNPWGALQMVFLLFLGPKAEFLL